MSAPREFVDRWLGLPGRLSARVQSGVAGFRRDTRANVMDAAMTSLDKVLDQRQAAGLNGERIAEAGRRTAEAAIDELSHPAQLEKMRRIGQAASQGALQGITRNLPLALVGYALAFGAGVLAAYLLLPGTRRSIS